MRICSGAGCLRAIADDVRFCDECQSERTAAPSTDDNRSHTLTDRVRYAFLYSGQRWQRTRAAVVKQYPFCACCQRRVTEIVDHIVPAGIAVAQARDSGLYPFDRVAGFFFRTNLQGLCRVCHADKTVADKTHSEWPDVVSIERAAPKRKYCF